MMQKFSGSASESPDLRGHEEAMTARPCDRARMHVSGWSCTLLE